MSVYSILDYGRMIADQVRTSAYRAALERAVRPGSVVVDLGAGTGVFSLLACRLGVSRVYAIEPACSIEVLRECAEAAGVADRVTCIQKLAREVELPERADVLVADLRGSLPLYGDHLEVMADAVRRFLGSEGIVIPRRDALWVALVSDAGLFHERVGVWRDNTCGLDLEPARRYASNTMGASRLAAETLLSEPEQWAVIDYTAIEGAGRSGEAELGVTRDGEAHGLAVWFDAELDAETRMSNSPLAAPMIYRQTFFPLPRPVRVSGGQRVHVAISAEPLHGDYLWRWRISAGGTDFEQSTFHGQPLAANALRRRSLDFRGTLNDEGRCLSKALEGLGRGDSVDEIAARLAADEPGRFPSRADARRFVAGVSADYGE